MDHLKGILVPVHREGYPFILIAAVTTVLLWALSGSLGMLGAILTAWCVYFFRDPERIVPDTAGVLVSPADGVLLPIVEAVPPSELGFSDEPRTRLSIFMNVFDVHVNRAPIDGTVTAMHYTPGAFFNASLDKASEDNERQAYKLVTEDAVEIGMVQIAGLVARRIVPFVKEGDDVQTGQRIGMIRFGSRVDLYLPRDIQPQVIAGQKMVAGETILAKLSGEQEPRTGTKI
jgi:phosphatidylserine decarboxylase